MSGSSCLNVSPLCPRKDLMRFVCQCLTLNSRFQSTVKNEKEKALYAKKKKGMLMDTARILGAGGSGGHGIPSSGGTGGNGGNVVIHCKAGASLNQFASMANRRLIAAHGGNCMRGKLKGKDGKNLSILVPPGTVIKDDRGKILHDLDRSGESFVLAKGGKGGTFQTPEYNGAKGERRVATLELKLIADIGLVGFPNAGKSTLLGSLSNAAPKVADYPFTTLRPTVGQIFYPDLKKVSVTDLPGLIEDAHLNKGMGHKFLRHIERTKALVLVIDVNGFVLKSGRPHRNPFESLCLLLRELVLYDKTLLSKPAILALNKVDEDAVLSKAVAVKNSMVNFHETANRTLSDIEIEKLLELCKDDFENVFTISAKYELGLEPLKEKLLDMVSACDPTISEDEEELTVKPTSSRVSGFWTTSE